MSAQVPEPEPAPTPPTPPPAPPTPPPAPQQPSHPMDLSGLQTEIRALPEAIVNAIREATTPPSNPAPPTSPKDPVAKDEPKEPAKETKVQDTPSKGWWDGGKGWFKG